MKKFFVILGSVVLLSSCALTQAAVQTTQIDTPIVSTTIASLDVSEKPISYTYVPTKAEAKSMTLAQLEQNAIFKALQSVGADEMVKTSFYLEGKTRLFWRVRGPKIASITVSGYPAKFKNFREPDSKDRENIDSMYDTTPAMRLKSVTSASSEDSNSSVASKLKNFAGSKK